MELEKADRSLHVDLIRVVAIVLVILLHAATESYVPVDLMAPQEVTRWWTMNIYDSIARPAVPLFIMLSGALLLQPSKLQEPLRVFFKKRLARIGVPFVFWGVAYFAWRVFANREVLSAESILQGIFTGPYIHFWFLYLIAGLYLITPLLRVIVAYAEWKTIKYFLWLWFIGTVITPFFDLFDAFRLSGGIFMITGWMGYFLLGPYLLRIRPRSWILYTLLFAGYAWTILGTYIITGTIGERFSQFFYDATSVSVIASSVALFMLLANFPAGKIENRFPRANKLLRQISQNTLPIYLFHVMVMEALQRGYFGFKISIATMNPIVEVPLLTVVTLGICLGVVYLVKKIPLVKKIIG